MGVDKRGTETNATIHLKVKTFAMQACAFGVFKKTRLRPVIRAAPPTVCLWNLGWIQE